MQDYMVFFTGYGGEIKKDEDNLDTMQVITKPVVQSTVSNSKLQPQPTKWHQLHVMVYLAKSGQRYNVAYQVMPDSEDIEKAIMRYRPEPVLAR